MLAMYEASGKVDPYFADINKSVTVNVAKVCMVGIPLKFKGRVCDIDDIADAINDFGNLRDLKDEIKAVFEKENGSNNERQVLDEEESEAVVIKKTVKNPFSRVIHFVEQELLGPGASDMFKQARGLRNQIDNFLENPKIRRLLTNENCIDFDRVFLDGQITVVNTALTLGNSNCLSLGMFFILSMIQALFRRPKSQRNTRHFWYIDELPLFLHPQMEGLVSLARQYRCAMIGAIQSLEQFKKSTTTKYLKGVFMGCNTHIVFGRTGPEEMEEYSKLAGVKMMDSVRETVSQTSILKENTSMSFSTMRERSYKNTLEGSDTRYRDFQEVTYFSSENGLVRRAIDGKASFLPSSAYQKLVFPKLDWNSLYASNKYVDHNFISDMNRFNSISKETEKSLTFQGSDSINVREGTELYLQVTMKPDDGSHLIWNTSDSTIVQVEDGLIHAIKPGNATVTVSTADGLSATCFINVCLADVSDDDELVIINDIVAKAPFLVDTKEVKSTKVLTEEELEIIKSYF